MSRTRAAVIGVGSFGRNHARVISGLKEVDLRGVVDTDLAKAEQVANEYGSRPYGEVDPVLQALRENSIEVTAVHNHMLEDQPRTLFVHFWTNDER